MKHISDLLYWKYYIIIMNHNSGIVRMKKIMGTKNDLKSVTTVGDNGAALVR